MAVVGSYIICPPSDGCVNLKRLTPRELIDEAYDLYMEGHISAELMRTQINIYTEAAVIEDVIES